MTDGPSEFKPGRRRGDDEGAKGKGAVLEQFVAELREAYTLLEDAQGTVFQYMGTHWEEISLATLRRLVWEIEHSTLTQSQRAEVVDLLRVSVHVRDLQWGSVADNEVACRSGVLRLGGPKPVLRKHRPEDYLESVIPHSYNPGAVCPTWDRFLAAAIGSDDEKYSALQDFFGYLLLPHAKLKTALVAYGAKPDTGKSVVVRVGQLLVGTPACCSLPASQMDDPQQRAVLIGKRLNLMTELPADAAIADGGFKALVSSEDPVLVNPKYKPPFMYTPRAKHIIATNNLPRVDDQTDAVFRRLLVIPFENQVPIERQDPALLDKLALELEGIFVWALEGAERLVRRHGVFTRVKRSDSILATMREEANPVAIFVRERLEPVEGKAIALRDVAAAFNQWNEGGKLSVRKVARSLRAMGLETDWWQLEGKACKALVGYLFRPEQPAPTGPDGPLERRPEAPEP